MEIKKSNSAQLEDKRVTFFLLGLLLAFTFIFVGLQYQRGPQGDDDLSESMEDLSQDLEMSARPDLKDMVSAEAVSAPASKSITQEVKAAEQQTQKAPQKISSTTSELVIGDGSGVVDGAEVKEAVPETPIENPGAEAPIKLTVVQKIPQFPGGCSAFMLWPPQWSLFQLMYVFFGLLQCFHIFLEHVATLFVVIKLSPACTGR